MELSVAEEILDVVLPSFEAVETQTGAILQFLRDKGIATDEQLAPYLEQSRNASTIRWRAVRLRINRLLAPAVKAAEKSTEVKSAEAAAKEDEKATEGPKAKNTANKGEDQSAKETRKTPAGERANNKTNRQPNRTPQLKRAYDWAGSSVSYAHHESRRRRKARCYCFQLFQLHQHQQPSWMSTPPRVGIGRVDFAIEFSGVRSGDKILNCALP